MRINVEAVNLLSPIKEHTSIYSKFLNTRKSYNIMTWWLWVQNDAVEKPGTLM